MEVGANVKGNAIVLFYFKASMLTVFKFWQQLKAEIIAKNGNI